MHTDLGTLCIDRDRSIHETMSLMDISRLGIVLVVDAKRRLVGTVTDGDVRRAILASLSLEEPITTLLARKACTEFAAPIWASDTAPRARLLELLQQHSIRHLPILDRARRVVGVVTLEEFIGDEPLLVRAVVMAGGVGKRLLPLTQDTPKPMLRVGDRPVLEIIIQQLREAGITRVKVTTHHKPEKITEHFGDGRDFGVELSYVEEDRPLGTVGGLGLLEAPTDTTLVINGDILTQVDFRAMLLYHREHQADLTVAVRQYDLQMPYGVVECEGSKVVGLSEKPVLHCFVNAGIYLLEPAVYGLIPNGQRFDMTDLIQCVLQGGREVVSFPVHEYWLDIGQAADYEQAQEQANAWEPR